MDIKERKYELSLLIERLPNCVDQDERDRVCTWIREIRTEISQHERKK